MSQNPANPTQHYPQAVPSANPDANSGEQQGGFIVDGNGAAMGAGPQANLISESSTDNFVHDVIEASNSVPIIVDFWAPWCEPCKTLGPMLEKLVTRAGGLVRLVKINAEENKPLAQQLQIKSIPTVYAFKNGKPVDAFQGALSETQLQAFIDKLVGDVKSPIELAMDAGNTALEAGDGQGAEDIFMQVLGHDETIIAALGGLIRAQVLCGNIDDARETVDALDDKSKLDVSVAAAISVLELAEGAAKAKVSDDKLSELMERVKKKPADMKAGLELALGLYANGDTGAAIERLLEMISTNRKWHDDEARKQLVKIFDALGPTDALTVDGRARLSIILFS